MTDEKNVNGLGGFGNAKLVSIRIANGLRRTPENGGEDAVAASGNQNDPLQQKRLWITSEEDEPN